jgi:ABC-type multidrug transport system ATPase subunit
MDKESTGIVAGARFYVVCSPAGQVEVSIGDSPSDEIQAEVVNEGNGWVIRDMGGAHPVLVDGREIAGRVELAKDSTVCVGNWHWSPRDEQDSNASGVSISLAGVAFKVRQGFTSRSLDILKPTTLSIRPGEFVGILGPSGSGKSTLLKMMIGDTTPTIGEVNVGGMTIAAFSKLHGRRLAYLPQELILHPSLSPQRALAYQAKLQGVDHRESVIAALQRVGIGHRLNVPISRLSGGEKKRVALAALLLADPVALFLDEATSGLDPSLEKEMMDLFRSLADEGRTVVCITHFPQTLEICDRLVVVAGGRVRFMGSPSRLKTELGLSTIEDVYPLLSSLGHDDDTVYHTPDETADRVITATPTLPAEADNVGPATQCGILLGRYLRVLASDPGAVFLLILQAPLIGLMIGGTFGSILVDYPEQHAADWKQVAFLLVMSVIWCSTTNGVREIVKEQAVFLHEKRYGVSNLAYLFSKFVPLSLVAIAQAVLLLVVLSDITGFAGGSASHGFVLAFLAVAGTSIGLAISAGVRSSEKAMTALPIILIAQGVLSGALARLEGIPLRVAELLAPAYWGLSGLKTSLPSSLLEATFVSIPGEYQHAILGRGPSIFVVTIALILQSAFLIGTAFFMLAKRRR